ncbi:acetyltransferase [Spirochaetota bacterium]
MKKNIQKVKKAHRKKELILIGGGGHCKACIDVIEAGNEYKIIGIIDKNEKLNTKILGYPVIGTDEDIPNYFKKHKYFLITVGQIESPKPRMRLFNHLLKYGIQPPCITSPYAIISKYATIDAGTIIMHNCIINASAVIGCNNIINSGALIEHDVRIGDHNHISTNSSINGNVKIGDCNFIGSGAVIRENIQIHDNVIIGAGSVAISNIKSNLFVAGNPVKIIKRKNDR